jgi:hypothetical protein
LIPLHYLQTGAEVSLSSDGDQRLVMRIFGQDKAS